MPSTPRRDVFDPETVGIYHCYNRCSQRAFLCGFDPLTNTDFSHRKAWLRDRLKELAAAMAIDVLDYAVLDNHLHVVLRNRPDLAEAWSDEEVVRRWWLVSPDRRDEQGHPAVITDLELRALLADKEQVQAHRSRLSDISWFMRQLCQPIARRANQESKVTGRFFAHRFGSERILDMAGLLACSMYVDVFEPLARYTIKHVGRDECEMFTSELAPIHRMILKRLRVPEADYRLGLSGCRKS